MISVAELDSIARARIEDAKALLTPAALTAPPTSAATPSR